MKKSRRNLIIISIAAAVMLAVCLVLNIFTKPFIFYNVKAVWEYDCWSGFEATYTPLEQDETAPENVTVSFCGASYSGTYEKTVTELPYPFRLHCYRGDNAEFYINANTGELIRITLTNDEKNDTLNETEIREIADSAAANYIELAQYEVMVTKPVTVAEKDYTKPYMFDYFKKINGIKTADGVQIILDRFGNIKFFRVYTLNAFDNVLFVKNPNAKRLEKALGKEVGKYYKSIDKNGEFEFEISETTLIKTPNGRTGFLYLLDTYYLITPKAEDGSADVFRKPTQLYFVVV